MTEADPGGYLTVREAADEAGRSPETIRRWVWSGRLPAAREGNRLVVARGDLERVVGPRPVAGLAAWRDQVLAGKAQERAGTRRSAADLVLADRRRRSSS